MSDRRKVLKPFEDQKDFLNEMNKLDNMLQGVDEDYVLEKIEFKAVKL